MLKNILSNIQNKYNNIKQENEQLNQLLKTTTTFQNLFPITIHNPNYSEHKITTILNYCPDLNEEKAQFIASIIPIQETYLEAFYTKELITNQEYYLIPTNQYLWIISSQQYGAFPYKNLSFQIIKNNIMSKIILFMNILLEINGSNQKIQNLITILNHPQQREQLIYQKTTYLQGITPTYQNINKLGSGISYDNQKNIVFHKKEESLKCLTSDLINYEILLDNQVYLSKNSSTSKSITNLKINCYQITIRITTKNQTFLMPILEPNSFGNKYNQHDSILQKNLEFSKQIIKILNDLTNNNY